jgi:hypothetical protein
MSGDGTSKPPGLSAGQILKLALGIVVFGVLMGVRTAFESIWIRALVAALAGVVFGWALWQARKGKA